MLYAKANDFVTRDDKLRLRDAANALMKEIGYIEPSQSTWEELAHPKPPPINTGALGKALELFVRRTLNENPQTDPLVAAEIFAKMESILPHVKSPEDAERWMEVGQQAVRLALGIEGGTGGASS
jgi:AAA+ ATPase superfamily predicted ATPase